MNESASEKAEIAFVRERLKDYLADRSFQLILESESIQDGWRGEFIGQIDDDDVIFLAHKPSGAPFATLCLRIAVDEFDEAHDCRPLMDISSDFDVALYVADGEQTLLHLTSRLLLSGVNENDFEFTFNNLLFCREAVIHVGDEEGEA